MAWSSLRVGRGLLVLLFVVYVAGLSPHLVHHLFDHDAQQSDCPFAAVAERQSAASIAAMTLVPGAVVVSVIAPAPDPEPREQHRDSIDVRGPPASA